MCIWVNYWYYFRTNNCANCDGTNSLCLECDSGFINDGSGGCVVCSSGTVCSVCSGNECSDCNEGNNYYSDGNGDCNICENIIENCANC